MIHKEAVMAYFNVGFLSLHSPKHTEETPQKISVRIADNPTEIRLLILRLFQQGCIASHGITRRSVKMGSQGHDRSWSWHILQYCPAISLNVHVMKKMAKILSQNIRYSDRDYNPVLQEYKSRAYGCSDLLAIRSLTFQN